jgi:hypothetical protein
VMPMTAVSGKYILLSARLRTEVHRRCKVAEKGFSPLGRGEYFYDVECFHKYVLSFKTFSASQSCNP